MNPPARLTVADLSELEEDWNIGGPLDPGAQLAAFVLSSIDTAISSIVGPIVNAAQSVINSITNSILSGVNYVRNAIPAILLTVQSLPNTISSALNVIVSQVSSILNSTISAVSSSLSQVSSAVNSGLNSILSSLNSAFSSLSNSVNATIRGIGTQLSGLTTSIVNGVTSSISSISLTLSSLVAQIMAGLNSAFASVTGALNAVGITLNGIVQQITSSISGTLGQIASAIGAVGSQVLSGLNTAFQNLIVQFNAFTKSLPSFQDILAFIAKFGSDPIAAISNGIDLVLKALGLPTLTDFRHELEGLIETQVPELKPFLQQASTFNNDFFRDPVTAIKTDVLPAVQTIVKDTVTNTIQQVIVLPEEIKSFFNAATDFFNAGQKHHSATGFDNFWSIIDFIANVVSSTGALGTLLQSVAWKNFLDGKGFTSSPIIQLDFFKPLTDYLNTIWTTIQQDAKPFTDAISKGFGGLVTAAITDFGLPTPAQGITDPFEMIGSTVTKEFDVIAKALTPKDFIITDNATKTIETVLAIVGVTEALEFGALAIEALHPTKKLQFMDKLKNSFSKIGVGEVTGIVGASLVGVGLSPFFRRYFNKLAQIQLVDIGTLGTMLHRGKISLTDYDSYLQEHGLNQAFRDGYKEIVYSLPSIRILRSIWMTGKLGQSGIEEIFRLGGMLEKYVPLAADAVVLQGLLPFLKAQETAFASQVARGFETGITFRQLLLKIGYPASFIEPTVAAADLKADEELNVLQVSEYDKQYTEGYITRKNYLAKITPLFGNKNILATHIDIADLAVQRMTDSRIRSASDRSIAQELTAFANGAVSAKEFEAICVAAKKTPEEITALEKARQIIYANLVRTVKFRNYQSALGKGNITVAQFEALCNALPIDQTIMKATEQHIILGMVKAAKLTVAAANALLAQANIALTAGSA